MEDHDEEEGHLSPVELARIGVVLLGAVASWFELWKTVASFDVIALVAVIVGIVPIFREALGALLSRRMTMELSMTIAIVAALVIGEYFTSVVIVLFVLVAEVLEHLTVDRGRQAIGALLARLPSRASVRRDGVVSEIPVSDLVIGDVVLIKPGSAIPVDGEVCSGHSFVDQSSVTGESVSSEKVAGSQVYAGTVNQSGALDVKASRIGKDTAFGRIIDAVEKAEKTRAPIQKTADRLAGYLVYFALASAAFTFLVTHNARSTISVVIVAGACGIAAGTPLAILGALGRAARAGAIVKGGLHLETLGRVDTVVLDKTGTLTLGKPEVVEAHPFDGVTVESLVGAAAIAERPSEHPLGRAVLAKAASMSLPTVEPRSFRYSPGGGIVCAVENDEIVVGSRAFLESRGLQAPVTAAKRDHLSEILVARGGRILGVLGIADVLRPEAIETVRTLRAMGIETVLLTGDAATVATEIGEQLGVDEIGGDLLPDQKVERVKALVASGRTVAMVGDGVNDAPALMQANVGVAMGSGTEVARESSSVLLLGDDLTNLVETLRIARACRRIITQNFIGTLAVDGVGVGLAAFGLLNPLLAAFVHVTSELAFILNSTRLLPRSMPSRSRSVPSPGESDVHRT